MIEVVITGIVALLVGASGGAVLKTRQTSKDLKARLMIEAEDSAAEKLGLLYEENKAKELDIRLAEAQALATQADRDQAEAVRLAEENRANELRREILQKESIVAEARKLELEAERRKELEELEVRLEVELCKLKEMIDNSGLSITIEGGQPLWLSMDQACDLPAISAEANSRVMMDLLARLGLLVVSPSFLPPLRSDIERNDIRNTRRPVHIESELSKWGSGYDYGDDFPCYQTNRQMLARIGYTLLLLTHPSGEYIRWNVALLSGIKVIAETSKLTLLSCEEEELRSIFIELMIGLMANYDRCSARELAELQGRIR